MALTLRARAEPESLAHCATDDWDYPPRYTDGVCPLCGERPEGPAVRLPWAAHVDWFWPSMAAMLLTSLLMAALVIATWLRGS